jgi:plasmid stabilization system protein ParE
VREVREWMKSTRLDLLSAPEQASSYPRSLETLNESEARLEPILRGEAEEFIEAVKKVRASAAPRYVSEILDVILAGSDQRELLTALAIEPALSVMAAEKRSALEVRVQDELVRILRDEAAKLRVEMAKFSDGLEGIAQGRAWRAGVLVVFASYLEHPEMRPLLEEFAANRRILVSKTFDGLVSLLEEAEDESSLDDIVGTYLLPDLDQSNATLAVAFNERQAYFVRQRIVSSYSILEKSLADYDGIIEVPAGYPQPTDKEVKLAIAREYGSFGKRHRDGTFDYGLIPETSLKMKVESVSVSSCGPENGAYRCQITISMDVKQSQAMRGIMGSSMQGRIMDEMLELASGPQLENAEHMFVLTSGGWRSPTYAKLAIRGISNSVKTVNDIATGTGCLMLELEC